jgi:hypothetical protein
LALAIRDGTVYAGGRFTSVGNRERDDLAAIDAATGDVRAWNPGADDEVDALAVAGGTVYAGGLFTSVGELARARLHDVSLAEDVACVRQRDPRDAAHAHPRRASLAVKRSPSRRAQAPHA